MRRYWKSDLGPKAEKIHTGASKWPILVIAVCSLHVPSYIARIVTASWAVDKWVFACQLL
jgi:hypothetical protein